MHPQLLHVRLVFLGGTRQWHYDSLERIFFENRIYKVLEQNQMTWEEQLDDVLNQMLQYQDLLHRPITMDDILKLVEKPVRKISKFDTKVGPYRPSFGWVPQGEEVVYNGSDGVLGIGINLGSFAEKYGIDPSDQLTVTVAKEQ